MASPAATVSTGIPGWGTTFGGPVEVVGQPVPEGSERRGAGYNMVSRVLEAPDDAAVIAKVHAEVDALCRRFPLYPSHWSDAG